jgi:hypothetical protein
MRGSLLLPISIGSEYFRSRRYGKVLESLPRDYNRIVFFIADRLQLYNRVLSSYEPLGQTIAAFFAGNDYLRERTQWLHKLARAHNIDWILEAHVLGIDQISDLGFTRILRNVHLLFACDDNFHDDVEAWARSYIETLDISTGFEPHLKTRLSIGFVLEEIACNIRLRVGLGIDDELYPGDFPVALPNLYRPGAYSATAEDLAMTNRSSRRYRFLTARTAAETIRVFSPTAE